MSIPQDTTLAKLVGKDKTHLRIAYARKTFAKIPQRAIGPAIGRSPGYGGRLEADPSKVGYHSEAKGKDLTALAAVLKVYKRWLSTGEGEAFNPNAKMPKIQTAAKRASKAKPIKRADAVSLIEKLRQKVEERKAVDQEIVELRNQINSELDRIV